MNRLTIVPDASDRAIADWVQGVLATALAAQAGTVAIAVPGGSTPFPILRLLAGAPLDWGRVQVWPGDDRLVPESHPASNVGKIRALLEPAGAQVVALGEDSRPPHFALCWLGMGADGHVASLFPNTDPQADDPLAVRRLTPDPLPPEAPFDRVTLTIPALLDADQLLFVLRGADKAALFQQAANGGNDLPVARLLRGARQPVQCFT